MTILSRRLIVCVASNILILNVNDNVLCLLNNLNENFSPSELWWVMPCCYTLHTSSHHFTHKVTSIHRQYCILFCWCPKTIELESLVRDINSKIFMLHFPRHSECHVFLTQLNSIWIKNQTHSLIRRRRLFIL
jgi:hypothetical protein